LKTKHLYALSFHKSHGTWFESSLGHAKSIVPDSIPPQHLDIASPMDCWESPCPAEQNWRITLVGHRCIIDRVDLGSFLDAYAHLYARPRNRHRCTYSPSVA